MAVTDEVGDGERARRRAQAAEWFRLATENGDADAAFNLGRRYLSGRRPDYPKAAKDWFGHAAELGSADMVWRITDAYVDADDGASAHAWMQRAVAAQYPGAVDGITVDPGVFPIAFNHRNIIIYQDFAVQVASGDHDRAATALAAARARFSHVAADGREFPDTEALHHAVTADPYSAALYTPNIVSPVQAHPLGPWLCMDCKDQPMPYMARTMLHVLVQELRAAGLDTATIRTAPPDVPPE